MNFRKSLSTLLSSFIAISTLGAVSSVKAENENSDLAGTILTCAAPFVLCFSIINLRNSIKNYKKISRDLEEGEKTTQKRLKDLNNKID